MVPSGVSRWSTIWADFLASIVVFLVALPLCMGIAIASGVPEDKAAAVGIITGIVGGIVVGLLAGCPLQVSGPAAGLAVIVGQYIADYGFATLGLIVLIAGVVQLIAGALGLGQIFRAVVPAVIQGMLAGIGVLIFAAQFHVMVDDTPPGTGVEFGGIINLYTIPEAVWKGLTEEAHQAAALTGVLTILSVVAWSILAPKRLRFFPAPLFGVILASLVVNIFNLSVKFITVPDNLLEAISLPTPDLWPKLLDGSILLAGVALAFVASAESLLTATAADAMQQHAPRTRYDRELAAQGVGNICCGLLGVLPMTGVIVRTTANILAGARTRLSTILHGFWLLIFAWFFPEVLRHIPIASLAAILVYTGWKLVNPKAIRALWQVGKGEVVTYAVTLGTVVIVDLLTGILAGIGLALLQLLYRVSHLSVRLIDQPEHQRALLQLEGAATFLRLPKLAAVLETIRPDVELHVDLKNLTYIDHACFELLVNWAKQHEKQGGRLVVDWGSLHARFRKEGENNENSKVDNSASSITPPSVQDAKDHTPSDGSHPVGQLHAIRPTP
jgi:MFS superfamily sulfate permease-like transporter